MAHLVGSMAGDPTDMKGLIAEYWASTCVISDSQGKIALFIGDTKGQSAKSNGRYKWGG